VLDVGVAVPKPEQGRVVLVEVFDPQDRNPKSRPAVIISETSEIEAEGLIACVAITTMVPDKVPDDCVLLPFDPTGKSRSGLKKRCAAKCSWLFEIEKDDIEKYLGILSPQKLREVLDCVAKLAKE
jgi:mRNA-degrading endonuclease toxin of MazEF toxin-antitoxin module